MSIIQKSLFKIPKIRLLAKYSSNHDLLQFRSNFTEEQKMRVLNTLNASDAEQLSRYQVSQFRIKNIECWKSKRGPFQSLGEVLEVEGLGEKLLLKLCEDILNDDNNDNAVKITKNTNVKITKRYRNLVSPVINGNILNNFKSAVGVHLSPIGISWAKINKENNNLVDWNFQGFSSLPNKMLLDETFQQVIELYFNSLDIVEKIPPGDLYIFETHPKLSPSGQTQNSAISAYAQQIELNAMLMALLNTNENRNVTLEKWPKDNEKDKKNCLIENRVFYLKSRTPARLFKTLVGQERVSAISIIQQLLDNNDNFSLPCTPVAVEPKLKTLFNAQISTNKELLGQALMLIISFMDLCVYKNPLALNSVSNQNKK
ncbi:unnamed protein product [Phyllotreta striolata]|uniref:Transcription elongation factor, mitochondrial n=1 Tax=Phyllotreta striolata TaxID=444603 RepID=A0A9N9XJQ1_PHYSR|nr:unnamed protein product [Phyllotreta striolata]